jgi:tRNA A-37 threonylcarbamoyl transferase component Bud32
MATDSIAGLVSALSQHRLLEPAQLQELPALQERFPDPKPLAGELIRRGWLTPFQANRLLQGKGQDLLLGSYVLLERLGEGGMGQVFKARNWKLGRVVALKLIRKERLDNPAAVHRFQREVRAAATLSHPHVVHAYDADEIGGTHLLVMEFLDQATDLSRLVKNNGPLPVATACDYIRQAALGLQHAHERGLVHRDVKPSNLLLTRGNQIKVLDLGLARVVVQPGDQPASSTTLTEHGVVMGTLDFISPEQILDAHAADIRADLYSLGCTFYFLLTGQAPFPKGSAGNKIGCHLMWQPPAVERLRPDVPAWLAAVLRKLMAKNPDDRFQTPAELAAALAGVAGTGSGLPQASKGEDSTTAEGGRGTADGQASADTVEPGWSNLGPENAAEVVVSPGRPRPARKRRLLGVCLAGGVVVVGLMVIGFLHLGGPGPNKPPEKEPRTPPAAPPPAAGKVDDAWLKQVAALPAEKQVEAVTAKLKERNPGFDGKVTANGVLSWVGIKVSDLSPLQAMKLTSLNCQQTQVSDLSPLKGMPLTYLNCHITSVADLSPLKGMPLTTLICAGTKVSDLSPLKGMPLTFLHCANTKVSDLSPLKGMKLTSLHCGQTQVSDLSPLKGMPLTSLACDHQTQVSDLSPLKGMPLTSLDCRSTKVSDLSPLKDMKLTVLNCSNTQVFDLSPLKGMPLKDLWCDFQVGRDAEILRSLKTLETINGKPAKEFWKEVEPKKE